MLKTILPFFLFIILLFGCQSTNESEIAMPDSDEIYGRATPIVIEMNETPVHLRDYFSNVEKIDSVSTHQSIDTQLLNNNEQLTLIPQGENVPWLSELQVWIEGYPYSILLKKSAKQKYTFTFDPNGENYQLVQIKGDVNNWNPIGANFEMRDGVWQYDMLLNPGTYQYLLVLDSVETTDPANPDSVDNNIGGFNSVFSIERALESDIPQFITNSHTATTIEVEQTLPAEDVFVYWENFRLSGDMVQQNGNSLTITIPEKAQDTERSFIRGWTYNEKGISRELLVPLTNGLPMNHIEQVKRSDKHAQVFYFIMVDRFFNGNPENDEKVSDPQVEERANYHGGDLAGIREKIEEGYFENLGINSFWLSPVVQNPQGAYREYPEPHRKYSGYHGYWPVKTTVVDHRFGTNEELKSLVDLIHENDKNIILDFVSNHVHQECQMIKDHPEWATTVNLPDGRQNIRLWNEHRLTTWFDLFLPSLDYSNPEVLETMSDTAVWWVKNFDIDGFRHDATKHIPETFWRTLTRKLKDEVLIPQDKSFYQVGETFGSRELIGSYVKSGMLDGQFDFGIYFDARAVFALDAESFERLETSVQESFDYYGNHSLMGIITGNHDIPRFISYAGDALSFEEEAQQAGWERNILVRNPVGYDKLSALTAFVMTIPGVPVMYYGDEIGMAGGGDPDNRRPMRFDYLTTYEKNTKETASQLIHLRRENLPLIYGDFNTLALSDKIWVYSRAYFNDVTIVAFNKHSRSRDIEFVVPQQVDIQKLEANFDHEFAVSGDTISMELPAYAFEIFTTKPSAEKD